MIKFLYKITLKRMFWISNSILANNELINKFFDETNLDFYYTNTVVKHLNEFIVATTSKGFTAKTTDIAEYSENHRTTIGHFLSHGVWDEIIKNEVLRFMLSQFPNHL